MTERIVWLRYRLTDRVRRQYAEQSGVWLDAVQVRGFRLSQIADAYQAAALRYAQLSVGWPAQQLPLLDVMPTAEKIVEAWIDLEIRTVDLDRQLEEFSRGKTAG